MRFEVSPLVGPVDGDLTVQIVDAPPRARVTVSASAVDRDGFPWKASALWLASEAGNVDVTHEPPVSGDFTAAEPMGLIVRMKPQTKEPVSSFTTADAGPMMIEFTAQTPGEEATVVVERQFQAPGVMKRRISEGGLEGELYEPTDPTPRPGVVFFPGEIDREFWAQPMAALLASRGYVTFVVDYFGRPGLPEYLAEIPLERVVGAVDFVNGLPSVQTDSVGLIGFERGSEAVMATGAYFPDLAVKAVVCFAPSCVIWQANGPNKPAPTSGWTYQGNAIAFMPLRQAKGQKLLRSITKKEGGAISALGPHLEAFDDREAFLRSNIPVERISAPLLMFAGNEDQQWPSGRMSEMIYKARRSTDCHEGDQKLSFDRVGRMRRPPYVPCTVRRVLNRNDGSGFVLGGLENDSFRADQVTWNKLAEFLSTHIGPPIPFDPGGAAVSSMSSLGADISGDGIGIDIPGISDFTDLSTSPETGSEGLSFTHADAADVVVTAPPPPIQAPPPPSDLASPEEPVPSPAASGESASAETSPELATDEPGSFS